MGFIFILMCLLCCGYGFVLIFAKDTAWNYVSWRNRNAGAASERTAQWDANATIQGVILIVMGLCLLLLLPHSKPSAQEPPAGQTTITIDGRPATPQEQDYLQHQIPTDVKGPPAQLGC